MSIAKATLSAIGKLVIIVLIGAAFVFGFFWTLKQNLYSPEVSVPNIIGKDVGDGESELERNGLNIRRRATRYSADVKPNTILDQSPHAGEIIKSGQTVAVVISRSSANEGETSVPVANQNTDENQNANNSNQVNNANSSKNQNNQNANKANKNRNKNSNNANNANNTNNRNANNRNANNSNRNANNKNANNNNGAGNKNGNTPANRNSNSGNRNPAPANKPANKPANVQGRDRVVNNNRRNP